jgi:hypothetical protein
MRGNFFPHSFKVPQIVSTNDCPKEGDDYCKKDLYLKSFLKEKEMILNPCITTLKETIIVTTFFIIMVQLKKK